MPKFLFRVVEQSVTRGVFALTLLAFSLGCERSGTSTRGPASLSESPRIGNLVVGPAAAALQANGQLRLAVPTPLSADVSEISELQARELAQAFIKTHGQRLESTLEADHGGAIDLAALHVCDRVWYANAAFEPLAAKVPDPWRRHFGPWWLVTMCGSGQRPQVSVAVSAYATDLQVRNGRVVYPPVSGGEFEVLGIPATMVAGFPASPERAVELAATASGVRVAGVPELVAAPPGEFPQSARWRLRLERPVEITSRDGSQALHHASAVTEIFVATTHFANPDLLQIADPQQPALFTITYYASPAIGSTRAQVEAIPSEVATIVRRPDFPVRYQAVQEN